MNKVYDVLIIGGGPVGMFCAYLAHIKGLVPILIESNKTLGGQPLLIYPQKTIHDFPLFGLIKAGKLSNLLIEQINSIKIDILLETEFISYKKNKMFDVKLTNNKNITCKSIIIACGNGAFSPNKLEIPHPKNNRIIYSVSNLDFLINKNVVILGGGDSAVDWANELSHIGNKIILVHRRNELRCNGDNANKLKENKVKVFLGYEVLKINNEFIEIKKNELLEKINYDVVLVQYGQSINNSLLEKIPKLNFNENKRIPVKINQMTNIKDVYAIGNVCIYDGKPSSIICGMGEASVAVRNIINTLKKYD